MKQITGAGWLKDVNDNFAEMDPRPATTYFVDTVNGSNSNNGQSFESAFATMTKALATVETGGKIWLFGKVAEECIGSNLVFDVTIEGVGSLHHADVPAVGYHPGASVWVSPGTPAGPLLTIRGRGWKIKNILFDCPTAYAGIRLSRNSGDGLTEYDASHASIIGCDFRSGLYGIEDYDGCFNVTVRDCVFETLDATATAAAIKANSGGGPASPRRWRILNNFFQPDSSTEGNSTHIVIGLVGSLIQGNVFGLLKSTGKYIDISNGGVGTPGSYNVICNNVLGGAYDTDDYVSGTGDLWYQNAVAVKAVTAPDGLTLAVPGAPG